MGGKLRHGHASRSNGGQSPTYRSWLAMKERCLNANHISWPRYGGRGISVCDRWVSSFDSFLADMGVRPPGTQLDRIDNAGNYEPGNCRWSMRREQALNRRTMLTTGRCRRGHDLAVVGAYVYEYERQRCVICKQCSRDNYLERKAASAAKTRAAA